MQHYCISCVVTCSSLQKISGNQLYSCLVKELQNHQFVSFSGIYKLIFFCIQEKKIIKYALTNHFCDRKNLIITYICSKKKKYINVHNLTHISTQANHLPEKKLCSLKYHFLKKKYYQLPSGKGLLFAQRGMKRLHSTSRQAFNLIHTPLRDPFLGIIQALLDQKCVHLAHRQYTERHSLHVHMHEHVHIYLYIYPLNCVTEVREPKNIISTCSSLGLSFLTYHRHDIMNSHNIS